jgi:hypothetical protein
MDEPRALALPLRVTPDGKLARAEGADSLLRLIQAMVGTTAGHWPHAPWFGLHEAFLRVNPDIEDHASLADALNDALAQLHVGWARVQRVRSVRGAEYGERRFDVTLLVGDEGRPVSAAVTP